ncbi:MAG: hypothetical protein UU23_C0001G0119 [Candidatus Curtissbacteria bacterium GW2011_GWA1_40_9]|uniref:Uncharacterized protein n=1 Tax=Candidatus Curtissbacteria bacterium GW2011_GWA1_40_9 TaxID=1618408 RepID=A0A0G0W240_9BACT|nr:MAG: hypothetical protein UU23_C0001G0119 [Candidatus Curtissbacteria bacterium GW2011_GWA1_40_9]
MKELIIRAGLVGSAAIFGGVACSSNRQQEDPLVKQQAQEATIAAQHPATENLFDTFYPEFKSLGLGVKELTRIDPTLSASKIPTEIVNYTQYKLQPNAIKEIYRMFESYTLGEPITFSGSNVFPNETIQVSERQNVTSKSIIFVPKESPSPKLAPLADILGSSAATLMNKSGAVFTYVRSDEKHLGPMSTVQEYFTFNLSVEICQQTLQATRFDASGQKIEEDKGLNIAQELVCNSFGLVSAFRLLGHPYEEYVDFIQTYRLGDLPFLLIDQPSYDSIRALGTVIK